MTWDDDGLALRADGASRVRGLGDASADYRDQGWQDVQEGSNRGALRSPFGCGPSTRKFRARRSRHRSARAAAARAGSQLSPEINMGVELRHLCGVLTLHRQKKRRRPSSTCAWLAADWGWAYYHLVGCHLALWMEWSAALAFYFFVWPLTFPSAVRWTPGWVSIVCAYNLGWILVGYGGWHMLLFHSPYAEQLASLKYDARQQYAGGMRGSPQLRRELLLAGLGWLQSSLLHCVMMHLWATHALPYSPSFAAAPAVTLLALWAANYWRHFHFYVVHRICHPWWPHGSTSFDPGALLFQHVHSWHHESVNIGPLSGLSMHPVDHFLAYTSAVLPHLLVSLHPLVFLFIKFHADLSPIAGHDGFGPPCGAAAEHWLHHRFGNVNYGTGLLINFDRLFGTEMTHSAFVKSTATKEPGKSRRRT